MRNTPKVNHAFNRALEMTINAALRYDPGTQSQLAQLDGISLAVQLTEPNLLFAFAVDKNKIIVKDTQVLNAEATSQQCDVALTGSAIDMIKLLSQTNHSLAQSGVNVSGKVGVLNEFQSIFANIDIDWETPFIEIFGPVAGHVLATGIRKGTQFSKNTGATLAEHIPEILTDELRIIPHEIEISHFIEEVNKTRAASNRLAARLSLLANQLNTTLK